MPRFDFRKLLIAYGALCGRWVNDAALGPQRAAHQRFFKTALALPMFAALAAPAALASGMSIASVFAALAASAGLSLALAAFVSVTGRLNGGLFTLSALAGVSFSLLAPLAGVSALIPLALLLGAETFFITRKPAAAIAASALAKIRSSIGASHKPAKKHSAWATTSPP